ncbi:hypothetical protein [Klebsiella variicola]|uniref:hypothetical protein n=1 Tax=Klebsiella variicola TaxID=244366 RepID=UPI000E2D6EF0|nr:hypothetical protein [Klebsiella variicola]ELA0491923.1 hypothetical protein [Klebsiella variicola]SXF36799.1 Uncharacterised protein [Klebsiella variicola]HDH0807633.1 hypothetical protein [Klebsiella variicola subsp. variicola]
MTITLQAVNELIASLESAGELSIREQKFLKLAKAHVQLAAENAALKSYRDTLDEIKSGLVGGGHGHMAKADMQAQSALLDVIFDAFDDIETPATDRIVAEAEARGVEKFADEQRGVAERLKKRGGDVVTSSIKFCLNSAEEAEDFAKQLRDGADK